MLPQSSDLTMGIKSPGWAYLASTRFPDGWLRPACSPILTGLFPVFRFISRGLYAVSQPSVRSAMLVFLVPLPIFIVKDRGRTAV